MIQKEKVIDVSISIVNYNSSTLVIKAIESILDNTPNHLVLEIIIVNNSPEDSGFYKIESHFIESGFNRVIPIDLLGNFGFSRGNNEAYKISKGKYFLIYNPDLFLKEDTITDCINFLEKNKLYKSCTVRFIYPDNSFQRSGFNKELGQAMFFSNLPYLNAIYKKISPNSPVEGDIVITDHTDIEDIDVACGGFLFIRAKDFEEIGGFDDSFFLYGEDWEICHRIRKIGKIGLINSTTVIHIHGGTSDGEFEEEGINLNIWSRKGVQIYVSLSLWQRKEFGIIRLMRLIVLVFLEVACYTLLIFVNFYSKKFIKRYWAALKYYSIILKNQIQILFNVKKVYRTM